MRSTEKVKNKAQSIGIQRVVIDQQIPQYIKSSHIHKISAERIFQFRLVKRTKGFFPAFGPSASFGYEKTEQ